jgi:hypothetical protein
MAIALNRIADCPDCGGPGEIQLFQEPNIHTGKPLKIYCGYCAKGLKECCFLEMSEDVKDMDTAIMVWNKLADERYYELHGIHRT